MPTYEYRCPNKHDFERFFRKISDAPAEVACPQCGEIAERRMSAGAGLLFKGSGFYLTDYGKNAHRGAPPDRSGDRSGGESKPAGEGGGAGGTGGSSDAASGSGGGEGSGGGGGGGGAAGGSESKSSSKSESGASDRSQSKETKAPKEAKPSSSKGDG